MAPHRRLTAKESELAAFLTAHGFVRTGSADFSRRYAAVSLMKGDFRLSDGRMIPVPNGPDGGADTRVFTYAGLGFIVVANSGQSLDDSKTGCSVSVSFDQVSSASEYPKTIRPNQSSEPTPTAGTSAAEQPLVPAAVVAHL